MPDERRRAGDLAVAVVLACWWGAMVATNPPTPALDGLRRHDRGRVLLPNWRLFAPRPVSCDVVLRARTEHDGRAPGPWRTVHAPRDRRRRDAVWFPSRRADKILSDAGHALSGLRPGSGRAATADATVHLELLAAVARAGLARAGDRWEPGYRFELWLDPGHDAGAASRRILRSGLLRSGLPVGGLPVGRAAERRSG